MKDRVAIAVLFTKDEAKFLRHLGRRSCLTPSEMITSVMRRHIKTRYRVPRKEWYYVFGAAPAPKSKSRRR